MNTVRTKLTKLRIDECIADDSGEAIMWDTELRGFGVRVFASGRKTYILQYRMGHRQRRLKLGIHGAITTEHARRLAKKALGLVADHKDPSLLWNGADEMPTIAELCNQYLEKGCATKKKSTLRTDAGRIERHIKPLLGRYLVSDVNRADVERFLKDVAEGKTAATLRTRPRGKAVVRGGKGAATRTIGLLGAIFTFAQKAGLRSDNPVRGIKKFPDRRLGRFLSVDEIEAIGRALQLSADQGENPFALAAIRLLALTGCRKNEIVALKWDHVNWPARSLVLPDSKTGHKIVPLGQAAINELALLKRHSNSAYVIEGRDGQYFLGVQKVWERVRACADLPGLRLHDLRHSFVSVGVAAGVALPVIGSVVGHSATETTARYAHLAKNAASDAADTVSASIAHALETGMTNDNGKEEDQNPARTGH